ncbi:AzlC family ABC transporter permease [Prosthecomicrobium pneumaticum]|uniref:Putative branched-subunit amino acid permease n=1 Tax=Prosthecomicrobium pneumaticum TaxID=81895 RepID=A0A7W9FLR6_9HYPH|nr:AzlC family ABC transporter permease [Prosthecomicrobium pneumaticum]MBB5752995.1 putative branched-subunit amino acid permease [Prosthecomicrobium pneumaticum]
MSAIFTRAGFRRGFLEGLPLTPGMAAFGLIYGVLAAKAGVGVVTAGVASVVVFAGTAQLLALHSWNSPDVLVASLVAVLAMNARYFLFGAAMQPWMRGLPPHIAYPSLFLLVDANWAAAMKEREEGRNDVAVFVGLGTAFMLGWTAGTLAGAGFGGLLGDTRRLGLDFFLPAFFFVLACGFWKGKADLVPLLVGGGIALAVDAVGGGSWHVLAGGLAGSVAGAYARRRGATA